MDSRPKLTKTISVKDVKECYWLKAELVAFCKSENLPTTGGKIAITNRIIEYLETGTLVGQPSRTSKPTSKFDWKNGPLALDTEITDNYSNTQLVRAFFENEIGSQFKFSVKLMNWMKANQGKTLADAIATYHQLKQEYKATKVKDIAPQFEYNTYVRDCLASKQGLTRAEAIKLWKIKRSRRGPHVFDITDLDWLKD